MRALITGANGFCAAHLVSRLRREPNLEIAALDQTAAPHPGLLVNKYLQCDITCPADVDSALKETKPDWIFHLAGLSGSSADASRVYQVNFAGMIHLLESVRQHSAECVVLIVGSFAEYGVVADTLMPVTEETECRPVGPYGISKYAATLAGLDYAKRCGTRVVVARPSNIVGAGVPPTLVVGAMVCRAKSALSATDRVLKVGDFESERDFIDAADAVEGYVQLVKSNRYGEIFNICSGKSISIRQIAELLVANSTSPIRLQLDSGLVPPSPIRKLFGSYEKARKAVGFQPAISIEESLRKTWCSEMTCESGC